MQNSKRKVFEVQWQKAFEGAESVPSETAWLFIENSIANTQNDVNKKRVIYYQRLAAALLILFLTSGAIAYLSWDDYGSKQIAVTNKKIVPKALNNESSSAGVGLEEDIGKSNSAKATAPGNEVMLADKLMKSKQPKHDYSNSYNKKNVASANIIKRINNKFRSVDKSLSGDNSLSQKSLLVPNISNELASVQDSTAIPLSDKSNGTISDVKLAFQEDSTSKPLTEEEEKELVKKMLAAAGVVTEESPEEKKVIISKPAWISIGAAGGSYSSSANGHSSASSSMDYAQLRVGNTVTGSSIVNKTASLGTAFSIGLMVGKQLNNRWIVQMGFVYMKRTVDYESNIVSSSGQGQSAFSPDLVPPSASASYAYANPYTVTGTSEFISIPAQVGFVLFDRKIGWSVNSGFSGDIFLKNSLIDKSGTYQVVSQSGSDNSTFRPVSWSGLANTEITLRLSDHYRFAVVPGFRYSITNIFKDESGYTKPIILDIGFRFRYTF